MKKRMLALGLAVCLTASLAGCGGGSSSSGSSSGSAATEASAAGGSGSEASADSGSASAASGEDKNLTADGRTVIRVGIASDPASFGPFEAGGNGKNSVYMTLYEPLAEYQEVGGEVKGAIAKSWEEIEPKTFNIEIWDNIVDTAGNEVKASDVAFCIETMKASGNFGDLTYVESVEVLDDVTIQVKMTSEIIGLFEKMMQATRIVSQKAYEESPDEMATTPIGTTHYVLAEMVSGSEYVFEKADSYWKDEAEWDLYQGANVDRIEYYYIPEESQLAIGLESGTIDMVCGISYTEAQNFMEGGSRSEGFKVFQDTQNLSQVLFFQCSENSPCSNEKLRQAILYAIDVDGLITGASNGLGTPCVTFGGNMFSDYNPEWENDLYYEYDVEKAKELLAESGFDTSQTLRIVLNNNAIRKSIAQIIQGYLLQIGVNCEINAYEDSLFNTYKSDETAYDICLDNCGGSDYLMTIQRGKFDRNAYKTGHTINGVDDDELQALCEEIELVHSAESMDAFRTCLYDHAYAVGLYNAEMFTVTTDVVESVLLDGKQFLNVANSTFTWN